MMDVRPVYPILIGWPTLPCGHRSLSGGLWSVTPMSLASVDVSVARPAMPCYESALSVFCELPFFQADPPGEQGCQDAEQNADGQREEEDDAGRGGACQPSS